MSLTLTDLIPTTAARRLHASKAAMAGLALALSLGGCAADEGEGDPQILEGVDKAAVGNWADQDTSGVGTHRITGDGVNVRGDNLSQVIFVADEGEQMALSYETRDFNGFEYYEAFFKRGGNEGARGWVAKDFLAHTRLSVCNASVVNVRSTSDIGIVIGSASSGDAAEVISGEIRNTGSHRYFQVNVNGLSGLVATDFLCASGGSSGGNPAAEILSLHDNFALTLYHLNFRESAEASALNNIRDAANGLAVYVRCGPACGTTTLKPVLLDNMLRLARDYGHSYFVTSIAGGNHSSESLHYSGRAFDVDEIDGRRVHEDSAKADEFMNHCRQLGAIQVFGPSNDPGHWDHVHCGW